jgi:diguanylate cyclase (GGDEF)-like protein
LFLVLLISIATVRSIVVPIRRLLKATAQLGKGDLHEPVPRGGIKELDTLAQSFNQMVDEVISARRSTREHQLELERRVVERTRQLQELAECDPLTGLPNRRHFLALLSEALKNAQRNQHVVGVFFLDLDNFKNINDSMGHGFGDRVLIAISQRLREITQDFGFAARLGGDEFTVVLTDGRNAEDVRNAGLRVIGAFQEPISVDNRDLVISVSAGASIYPDHEQTAEGLLQAADAALFRAKALGRSQLSVFTPELLAAAAAKFTTEQGLRRAVDRGEFELVFQPEISSETLQTALVEALVRWRLPDGKLATPNEFLAVAEESGLIVEISDWVLRSAIQTAAGWHHGVWPQARVAINVSARQLLDHRFVERVESLLQEFKLPACCIEIELTETVLQTGAATIDTLNRLRARGIATALDDFGTGYSSLTSLEHLPFTRIKLDRSLIAGIDTSARSLAITRSIVGLCHGLDLEVTAEGVERPEQFAILLSHRPIYLQGYLFSQGVSVDELVPTMGRIAEEAPLLAIARSPAESSRVDASSDSPVKRSKRRSSA